MIPGSEDASIARRGSIAIGHNDDLYLALPDSVRQSLRILKATQVDGYKSFEVYSEFKNCHAEPLIDKVRLKVRNELSVLTT